MAVELKMEALLREDRAWGTITGMRMHGLPVYVAIAAVCGRAACMIAFKATAIACWRWTS